ncbi:hypothetical protein P154DRAFT_592898 [Amniculicola lignicola CBS 123094]|uniref:Uncharacterized protein n=1 Tax=Amniculicola lignicola CBS 123094 TaxID=1392246 RepID=A0A6A5X3P0_9PLEO|nr:hypothetical protein P154DRAFT_592898 [Amniculicola lignicola CBS 123094]
MAFILQLGQIILVMIMLLALCQLYHILRLALVAARSPKDRTPLSGSLISNPVINPSISATKPLAEARKDTLARIDATIISAEELEQQAAKLIVQTTAWLGRLRNLRVEAMREGEEGEVRRVLGWIDKSLGEIGLE